MAYLFRQRGDRKVKWLLGSLFWFTAITVAHAQVPPPSVHDFSHDRPLSSGGLAICQISKVIRNASGVSIILKRISRGSVAGTHGDAHPFDGSDHIEATLGDTIYTFGGLPESGSCSMTVVKDGNDIGVNVPELFFTPGQPVLVSNFLVKAVPAD